MSYEPEDVRKTWDNIMNCKDRIMLVQGCAGSRKTDLIVNYAIHKLQEKKTCLFLTMVNSVADEISQRLRSILNVSISQQGSHMMINVAGNRSIEIASLDAFIHCQLDELREPLLFQKAVFYEWKAGRLLEAIRDNRHGHFVMKNGLTADMVIVDEFQDMDPVRTYIVTELMKRSSDTCFLGCGDILQSIFDHGIKTMDALPFKVLQRELSPTMFKMNHCFRCPAEHIIFVNRVMQDIYQKYDIPAMIPVRGFDDGGFKPWLIPMPSGGGKQGSYQNAIMIAEIIDRLVRLDPEVKYSDIAILNKRVNNQPFFHHLQHILQKKGLNELKIAHTKRQDDVHQPINWEHLRGNLIMISVHGDKGKGHKVIFFVGATNYTFPDIRHPSTWKELFSESLLNVSLTRGTRHLFIAIPCHSFPTYFTNIPRDEMRKYAACLWEDPTGIYKKGLVGQLYRSFREIVVEKPMWETRVRVHPVKIPRTPILHADHDILPLLPDMRVEKVMLDTRKKMLFDFKEDEYYEIMKGIVEMMLLRSHKPAVLFSAFEVFLKALADDAILFTYDIGLLALAEDLQVARRFFEPDHRIFQHLCMPEINTYLRKLSLPVIDRPHLIISSNFRDMTKIINVIIDKDVTNEQIPPSIWWKCQLLWEVIDPDRSDHHSRMSPTANMEHLDFTELYSILRVFHIDHSREDTQIWKNTAHRMMSGKRIREVDGGKLLDWSFDRILDDKVFKCGFEYGMCGQTEFVHRPSKTITQLIMSKNDFQPEWFSKSLFYSCQLAHFNHIRIRHIQIFNPNKRCIYKIRIPKKFDYTQFIRDILAVENFPEDMVSSLMTST